ncbi:unnamed protein product [Heterosigma akashiwo]
MTSLRRGTGPARSAWRTRRRAAAGASSPAATCTAWRASCGWLARSCTCPACRFELPTDDAAYEGRRRRRMADRQLRYRPEELSAKPLRELTALCRQLGVPTAGVLEKRGLVDALLASGKIKILEETHVELSLPELQSKSIKELRKIMVDLGISRDLCGEIRHAGCHWAFPQSPPHRPGRRSSGRECARRRRRHAAAFEGSLKTMSVGDLKRLMRRMNLDPDSCLEKADMIRSILSAR